MNETIEALFMPIQDEAHHQQVWADLEYARRIGDLTAVTLLMAQLAHSQSWRPTPQVFCPCNDEQPVKPGYKLCWDCMDIVAANGIDEELYHT